MPAAPGEMPGRREAFTAEADSDVRLDSLVAQRLELSRTQAATLIATGQVTVTGRREKASYRPVAGEEIVVEIPVSRKREVEGESLPISVVFEDEDVLVVDKAAGMVVHPAPGNYDNTLVNALLFHCHDLSGIGGVLRPGIVHRLDKDTTGLIVAAKTDDAHRRLSAQFEKHEVHKKYAALVWGDIKGNSGEMVQPVGRHPGDRKKMSTKSTRGKDALTLWKVRERYGPATLLDAEIKTGRTHQIRVHLSERGYPVIGDSVYGGTAKVRMIADAVLKAKLKAFNRQALHASTLSFLHPLSGERVVFTAPLPADMNDLCAQLRAAAGSGEGSAGFPTWKDKLR